MCSKFVEENYDVVVVGAGHAGCEAALACARLGLETIVFTVSVDSIALMPCNPNIGGSSKGHLVREIDALGGEMGKNIDKTFIQSKMLNKSKGPAVHSLRAQADKAEYSMEMRKTLQNTDHLTIRQGEVSEIVTDENNNIVGAKTTSGALYHCKAIVLCTGTYLRARCLTGEMITHTGPNGLLAANHLTQSLIDHGIEMRRFKTGTPARVDKRSLDFSKMEEQFGDERVVPFSFTTDPESVQIDQVSCWLTYTNSKTHEIIRNNLDRSPIYAGIIEGTGPRYCPSIEDKVVKFAEKERHQIFIEPEGLNTNEMYVGGMSSSMPEDVQYEMYRTLPGLENVKIVRDAYAIEYDCINANQLYASLEFKKIHGLFSGGQFNGSSGYEEACGHRLRLRRHHRRRLRPDGFCAQRGARHHPHRPVQCPAHARVHHDHLHDPRHGPALYPVLPHHRDHRRSRARRAGPARACRAPVLLLLCDVRKPDAACRACIVRGGGPLRRQPDEDRLAVGAAGARGLYHPVHVHV